MFDIANAISYNGKMVQGKPDSGEKSPSCWIDSRGKATHRQFVAQHAVDLAAAMKQRLTQGCEFSDIFVISPFTAVVGDLKRQLKVKMQELSVEVPAPWLKSNIGTVHTFQGKEAKIVFFVVGTDKTTDGAASWAFGKPNLLNVAVTRAKKEFYVVGDRERLSQKPFISVAAELLPVNDDEVLPQK